MRAARLAAVLLWAALGACGGRRTVTTEADVAPRPGEVVVATVGGTPITAARVAAHAQAIGRPPRAALEDLIAFELLAQEAARRGAGADPEVAEARKREAARRFLQQEFEAHHRPEDIPDAELRTQYQRNLRHFEHPELSEVISALFNARRGRATKAELARAQARAQELTARLKAEQPKDGKTARQIMELFEGDTQQPMRIDEFTTWPGAPADPDWLKVALTLRRPGQISEPVRSEYGWHVIYLKHITPALKTPEPAALAVVRRELHPLWQRAAFSRFLDELQAKHAVTLHPELLRPAATAAPGVAAPPPEASRGRASSLRGGTGP
jgi:hypothetical protein